MMSVGEGDSFTDPVILEDCNYSSSNSNEVINLVLSDDSDLSDEVINLVFSDDSDLSDESNIPITVPDSPVKIVTTKRCRLAFNKPQSLTSLYG